MSAQRTQFNNDQSAQICSISRNVQIQTATSSSTTNASTSNAKISDSIELVEMDTKSEPVDEHVTKSTQFRKVKPKRQTNR